MAVRMEAMAAQQVRRLLTASLLATISTCSAKWVAVPQWTVSRVTTARAVLIFHINLTVLTTRSSRDDKLSTLQAALEAYVVKVNSEKEHLIQQVCTVSACSISWAAWVVIESDDQDFEVTVRACCSRQPAMNGGKWRQEERLGRV